VACLGNEPLDHPADEGVRELCDRVLSTFPTASR
jgi:hypothetical protein